MTKREIIKWLEDKQSDAVSKALSEYETIKTNYIAKRDAELGIDEIVSKVSDLMSEASQIIDAWKVSIEKVKDIRCTDGYAWSLSSDLMDFAGKGNLYEKLKRDFIDDNAFLPKLKDQQRHTVREIRANYLNVIANVKNFKKASDGLEYLKELGFDVSDLVEADQNPMSTDLTVPVDTKFLFIGDTKNDN